MLKADRPAPSFEGNPDQLMWVNLRHAAAAIMKKFRPETAIAL